MFDHSCSPGRGLHSGRKGDNEVGGILPPSVKTACPSKDFLCSRKWERRPHPRKVKKKKGERKAANLKSAAVKGISQAVDKDAQLLKNGGNEGGPGLQDRQRLPGTEVRRNRFCGLLGLCWGGGGCSLTSHGRKGQQTGA